MPALEETKQPEVAAERPLPAEGTGAPVLSKLFGIFFVQLFLLIAGSFVTQFGPVFVVRLFFGLDYYDFYRAATDWLHQIDPYLRGRLYTPPSSILVGLAFSWLPFPLAAFLVLLLNIGLVYLSLKALSRQFGLSRANERALIGITFTFYPFYFLVERGNLDGIMLALLVFGFASRRTAVRALMLGASVAVKIYSGLLFALMLLRKRNWNVVSGGALVFLILQLPFIYLVRSFVEAIAGRTDLLRLDENISPAVVVSVLFGGMGPWKLVFLLLWLGTLLYRVSRDRGENMAQMWPVYVPWMISFPTLVYPYSGVLALALVALIAGECQRRQPRNSEKMVLVGFGLLGFQAVAWTTLLLGTTHNPSAIHMTCAIGTLFMIAGACGLPKYQLAEN